MRELWYSLFHRVIALVYFERVRLLNPELLPATGPVLFLGLHRNGAVDGFVYRRVVPRAVFMISTQLRRSWFARLFFDGIAVQRPQDAGDPSDNEQALGQCLKHLQGGGELFIFPEGTSWLGPRRLPLRSGAVWLISEYLKAGGPPLTVIPAGIHYECPWAFRSRVEVVLGKPICTALPPKATAFERIRTLKTRVAQAFDEVGINVGCAEHQALIERLACDATLGTARSYFQSLKQMERAVPWAIQEASGSLPAEPRKAGLLTYHSVPLFPFGSGRTCAMALAALGLVVAPAMLLNMPPVLAGWLAARKLADDRNVISLWKILVGIPTLLLWTGLITAALLASNHLSWLLAYAACTVLGIMLYARVKKLGVAVHNALRRPDLRAPVLKLHQTILHCLPDEAA